MELDSLVYNRLKELQQEAINQSFEYGYAEGYIDKGSYLLFKYGFWGYLKRGAGLI